MGSSFACALLNGGGVYCWGYNNNGQLGNGGNPQGSTVQSMGSKMLPVNFGASVHEYAYENALYARILVDSLFVTGCNIWSGFRVVPGHYVSPAYHRFRPERCRGDDPGGPSDQRRFWDHYTGSDHVFEVVLVDAVPPLQASMVNLKLCEPEILCRARK